MQRRKRLSIKRIELPEKKSTNALFKEKIKSICKRIEEDFLSRDMAALVEGLTEKEFRNHQRKNKKVEDYLKCSEAKRDAALLKKVLSGDENSRWLLSRLSPEQFAKPGIKERKVKEDIPEQEEDTEINYENENLFLSEP